MEVKAKVDKRLSGKDGNERIVSINIIISNINFIIIFVESQQVSSGSWSGQHPGLGHGPDSCLIVPTNCALQSSIYTLHLVHCTARHVIMQQWQLPVQLDPV